ncbi:PrgI family protein [Actinoallomurus sp. NPDC050550]|uniref:PrgI family protein n=1 Tax=Actinoallomurus sp. NPDC050550 TaxID=3154937 RepID=UPI0034001CC0
MSRVPHGGRYATRIPADIDREDRILANLTARQVAILGGAGAALWAAFMATRHLIPPLVFLACSVPFASVAVAFALVRREGQSLDRLALAAVRQRLAPRRYVPRDVGGMPHRLGTSGGHPPAPFALPVTGIHPDGLVELGGHGCAAVIACGTVSFALATIGEQEALVAGFARCLHGLSSRIQILARAERMDLMPMAVRVFEAAPGLPDAELEEAAKEHARFLADLADHSELLWRQVLVVVRDDSADPNDADSTPALRQAEQVAAALTAAGFEARVLDGPAVSTVLAAACDPNNPTPCSLRDPYEVVRSR